MAVEIEQESIDYKDKDKDVFTCERCNHFSVCFLRKNINEFMEQHFQKDEPFETSDLAKICSYYYPELKLTFEQ